MAQLIKANGEQIDVTPKNGKDFKFEELKEMIGGWIEIVRLRDDKILVVDEEGMCKEKDINPVASLMAGFTVVGDVVFCNNNQVL